MTETIGIAQRLAGMSEQELQDRFRELQQQAKDLSDIGLELNAVQQTEAMMIMALRGLMENPVDGLDECDSDIDDSKLE